jgi:prolipoprotein diacylglyceryltransferase
VALYEAALDLALAAWLFAIREATRVPGRLFKTYALGYAMLRFALEPLRGDGAVRWGPLSSVQWVCLACGVWMLVQLREGRVNIRGAAT